MQIALKSLSSPMANANTRNNFYMRHWWHQTTCCWSKIDSRKRSHASLITKSLAVRVPAIQPLTSSQWHPSDQLFPTLGLWPHRELKTCPPQRCAPSTICLSLSLLSPSYENATRPNPLACQWFAAWVNQTGIKTLAALAAVLFQFGWPGLHVMGRPVE